MRCMQCNDELQKAITCLRTNYKCSMFKHAKLQMLRTHCNGFLYLAKTAHVGNAQQFPRLAHVRLPCLTHMLFKTK